MIDTELKTGLMRKAAFIKDVGAAFRNARTSVVSIELQVFYEEEHDWTQEYLVITFKGGAISVRNANVNSDSANFRELGKMIDGGYYSEVEDYQEMVKDKNWKRII